MTRCFLGEKFCTRHKENQSSGTAGTLESKAHTGVHIWLGDPNSCMTDDEGKLHCKSDMGFLGTAARDPAFYSHHANVDRMWHLWAHKLGHRNFGDPEWLDTSFIFYDETARPVRVRVHDVLDAGKLRYRYVEREPLRWMGRWPTLRRPTPKPEPTTTRRRVPPQSTPPVFPLRLKEGRNMVVPSVRQPASGKEEKGKLEVLVFDGVEFNQWRSWTRILKGAEKKFSFF